jgi:hypothetical protein
MTIKFYICDELKTCTGHWPILYEIIYLYLYFHYINVFIICFPGEPGMFVGLISSSNAIQDFHGYISKEASSRKIICNVFRKGDKAFLSGEYTV